MNIVAGMFANYVRAEDSLTELLEAGFGRTQISIIIKQKLIQQHLARFDDEKTKSRMRNRIARSGLGALMSILVGIGPTLIDGIGSVILAGPIRYAISRNNNRPVAALKQLGMKSLTAQECVDGLTEHEQVLLMVHVDDASYRVKDIMSRYTEKIYQIEVDGSDTIEFFPYLGQPISAPILPIRLFRQ